MRGGSCANLWISLFGRQSSTRFSTIIPRANRRIARGLVIENKGWEPVGHRHDENDTMVGTRKWRWCGVEGRESILYTT
jgi:hypothetical protein